MIAAFGTLTKPTAPKKELSKKERKNFKKAQKKAKKLAKKEAKNRTKSKTFDIPYTRIMVARKIMGMWFETVHVNRMWGEDALELFRRTRDHYKTIWGPENVRLRLYWPPEYYDGNGHILIDGKKRIDQIQKEEEKKKKKKSTIEFSASINS
jgi:hypothetical protein